MFTPSTILIHPDSIGSAKEKLIVANAKKFNPRLTVQQLPPGRFSYPAGLSTVKHKFDYWADTVILRPRVAPFIVTFASPGEIVEKFTTILNLAWHCPFRCEFCYLQTTRPGEHFLYTNIEEMALQLRTAPYAHKVSLTVWGMLSKAMKTPLLKIPEGLRQTTDRIREDMTSLGIQNDADAVNFLNAQQKAIHEFLSENARGTRLPDLADFKLTRKGIQDLYDKNKRFMLKLTASEFTDLLGVDHLADYSGDLLPLLGKIPDFAISIRSKSGYVDNLIKHDGMDRVTFACGLNTPHVINTFEHGTATLDERLHAARRVQEAKGFRLKVVIEPMIRYPGFKDDYRALIDRVFTELDPSKIGTISIGSVRFRKQLQSTILEHHPSTTLFDSAQELQEPIGYDQRLRYSLKVREEIYKEIVGAIRKHSNVPVVLGAESPQLWPVVGIDPTQQMATTVTQFEEEIPS